MELPLGGPALRHYTQSRPRPHRQKLNYRPTRPQETIIESENEVLEFMGRVDEGVEEFFTKRVLPPDTAKTQEEESITVHEVVPASSAPCPPATKTLRRKLGDFFTLKKRRGLKSETSQEGRPKKASIADFIRPLKEVGRADKEKDKDRVREPDKENEKEKTKELPSAVAGEVAVQEAPVSGAPPLRGEAVPPRRALREGKSQSLILLSGSSAAGATNAKNAAKKQLDGQNSFEQKLHLMLQRIGVSKAHPGETQNPEGEMKKADSEGTIIDSKPEPPPTFTKPRTMSASSDTRHQIRPSVSAHESAGKPALLPKPVLKPGPPPATSGRNTPENELAQIQEGETNTPTKLSPSAAPLAPAVPALTDTAPATILTISNSAPDSTTSMTPPSGTVMPSDPDACADSVISTAAATTPTNIPELDSKPSVSEAKAGPDSPTTLPRPAAAPEPAATVPLTSTPSESMSPRPSANSNVTTTTPSTADSEAASAPSCQTSNDTKSTDQSTTSAFPGPGGALAIDAAPEADAVPVISAEPLASSGVANVSAATSSVSETREDSTSSSISTSSVTLVSSVTKPTSPAPDSMDAITSEPPISSISSLVPSSPMAATSTLSTTDTTTASTNCVDSTASTPTVTHPATPGSADTSTPPTSSCDTNPTDTTTTTTSLNQADTTSTTSSGSSAAITSPLQTDPDPPYSNDVGTTLTGDPSTTSHHVGGPVLSSQASPEERSRVEPAETSAADEVLEMIEQGEPVGTDGNDSESERDESAPVHSQEPREEEQEESVEPEGEAAEQEVGTADPAAGKDGEMCSEEGLKEDQKEEEAEKESVHEK